MTANNLSASCTANMDITLAQFRNNPFCPNYIIDTLIANGYNTLEDVACITLPEAMAIRGFGKGKVEKLMKFRDCILSSGLDKIGDYYRSNVDGIELPHAELSDTPLSDRITDVLSSVADAFERKGKSELAIVCREGLLLDKPATTVYQENTATLGVTRERVRQQIVWVKNAILNNGLSRFRVVINDAFIAEVAEFSAQCENRPVSFLRKKLGDSTILFTRLFGFDIAKAGTYSVQALDEDFLVGESVGVITFTKEVAAIIAELHSEVRPMYSDELFDRVRAVCPEIERDRFDTIVDVHSWIEKAEDGKIQMKYSHLHDSGKVARLLWENKSLTRDDIDLNHTIITGETRAISNSLHVAQSKYGWIRPVGKTGEWIYSEQSRPEKKGVRDFIREYVAAREVFSFSVALSDVAAAGYSYPERTIRAYFMSECMVSIQNSDLLCARDKAESHSAYTWRRKVVENSGRIILEKAVSILQRKGPMSRPDLTRAILAMDSEGQFAFRCVWQALNAIAQKGEFLRLDVDGNVCINEDTIQDGKLDPSLVKNSRPSYYDAVMSVIRTRLQSSPEGSCLMSSIRSACEDILRNHANPNIFYKIIALPEMSDIEKVYIDGSAYLRQVAA